MTSMKNHNHSIHPSEIYQILKSKNKDKPEIRVIESLPFDTDSSAAVYTTIRTFHRKEGEPRYLYLDDHIQRLNDSLLAVGAIINIGGDEIKSGIKLVSKKSTIEGEVRLKIIINPAPELKLFIQVEPLTTPSLEEYAEGVTVFTYHYSRENPEAKRFGFVGIQDQIRLEFNPNVEEILLLGENEEFLEGLSSNFISITHGAIQTAETGILHGITRKIVLDIAKEHQIPVEFRPIKRTDLDRVEECFITSTSRGVLPVIRINQKVIGTGKPGPITRFLRQCFDEAIESLIQPL